MNFDFRISVTFYDVTAKIYNNGFLLYKLGNINFLTRLCGFGNIWPNMVLLAMSVGNVNVHFCLFWSCRNNTLETILMYFSLWSVRRQVSFHINAEWY